MDNQENAIAEANSIANTGDNVSITLNHFSDGPKRSIIFNVCRAISESNIEYDEEYSIKNNANWLHKFSFNNVKRYQEIFEDYASGYDKIEEILRGFPFREMTIRKIHTCYLKSLRNYDTKNFDGDSILEDVFKQLKTLAANVNVIESEPLYDESIDEAIYLIMFYAFSKCKLLQIPSAD